MTPPKTAPLVFESAGRVFRPDTCEPLKQAAQRGEMDVLGWSRGSYPGTPLPDRVLPGVRTLGAWDAHHRQHWGLGEHCNEGIEITFLSRGMLSFSCAGQRTMLRPGEMTVTAPWLIHEVGLPMVEASRLVWVILDVGVRRPNQAWQWPDWVLLTEAERQSFSHVLQNSDRAVWDGSTAAAAFEALYSLLRTGDPVTSETDVKIQLNVILMRIARALVAENGSQISIRNGARETIRLFLERLEEHIDYPWKVEEMASQCGVSRGTFILQCRELLNRTPHEHLMHLRLQRARQMLVEADGRSMTDIAMDCGFSSSAHFSYSFRRENGMTPSAYRENCLEGLAEMPGQAAAE
jgi:AraC family L-rhamnose operon regulatory protein RhaS